MTQSQSGICYKINSKSGVLEWTVLPRFSNLHAHLRTGPLQEATAVETMRPQKHLVVMPNNGPITTIEEMDAYYDDLVRIRDAAELETNFIMTLYLTSALTPNVVERMTKLRYPCAVKYYPPVKGATTGSGHGIPLGEANEVLGAMAENGVRLLGHFETVYDAQGNELPHELREGYFMENDFPVLRDKHVDLLITIEHATTATSIERVKEDPSGKTICGITPQAMILVREDLDKYTWGVHGKCMPIAKTREDRTAVTEFATSGDFRAHLGDDTAPHPSKAKLVPFGKAASGCFLPHSSALYVSIFHKAGKLDNLPAFACYNGPDAWGLERPDVEDRVLFVRNTTSDIPNPLPIRGQEDVVIPFGWTTGNDAFHPEMKLFIP